jgi:hypothetical protein
VREAPLTRGVRQRFVDRADHARHPVRDKGSAASRRRMSWKNSGQLCVVFLLGSAPVRCLNVV